MFEMSWIFWVAAGSGLLLMAAFGFLSRPAKFNVANRVTGLIRSISLQYVACADYGWVERIGIISGDADGATRCAYNHYGTEAG
jgi:hypothetical protein